MRGLDRPSPGAPSPGPPPADESDRSAGPGRAVRDALRRPARTERLWRQRSRSLQHLGGLTGGNRIEVVRDGALAFELMWDEIGSARRRVWLDVYGFGSDRVGRLTLERLEDAARRGCEVRIIYDAIGSRSTPDGFFDGFREAGGQTVRFNPVRPWRRRLPLNVRDHRKILLIDHHVAFCGGMNITADYAGPPYAPALFRDCQLRIEGPGAAELERIVLDTIAEATGQQVVSGAHDSAPAPLRSINDRVLVQVLGSNTQRNVRSIQRALRTAIGQARQRCFLTTPYFVPPRRLARAMVSAAQRGVDVRLLTAGRTDIPLAHLAARHHYRHLLSSGIRIFEMRGEVIHTKRASVDGELGMIGSFNLDHWSDRHNLEVAVVAIDPVVAGRLEEHFLDDVRDSVEISIDEIETMPLTERLLQPAAAWVFRL
jgi:cardiolipin synthase